MIAAANAAGCQKSGPSGEIEESAVIDILLAYGADKQIRDPQGLTAYGNFIRTLKSCKVIGYTMFGPRVKTPR
jgi:hypothetical protein